MDRRSVLLATVGSVVASVLVPGVAAAEDLPDVPGMLGDRRANELWYQLDQRTIYAPAAETSAAFRALGEFFGTRRFLDPLRETWHAMAKEPDYPNNWREFLRPVRGPLDHLSKLQLDLFDSFYRPNSWGLVEAHLWFAQGVLFDPRLADSEPVHTMSGNPPTEYHVWFAVLRGQMLLGIDAHRWAALAPVIGYAWALQSIAKPSTVAPNPGLPPQVVAEQAARWLPKSIRQLDRDFQSAPFPAGI